MESVALIPSGHKYVKKTIFRRALSGWRAYVSIFFVCLIGLFSGALFIFLTVTLFILWLVAEYFAARKSSSGDDTLDARKYVYNDDNSPRVRCVGFKHQLESLAEIQPGFFEPLVVRSCRLGQTIGPGASIGWFRKLVGLSLFAVWIYYSRNMPVNLRISGLVISLLLIETVVSVTFPVYYRVTPGRFDVLTTRYPAGDLYVFRSISLHDAEVRCLWDYGYVYIRPPGEEVETISLSGIKEEEQTDFIGNLLQGAITRQEVPDLPKDELVG